MMECNFCGKPASFYTLQQSSIYCGADECKQKADQIEAYICDEFAKVHTEQITAYEAGYSDAWIEGCPLSDNSDYMKGWNQACLDAKSRDLDKEIEVANNIDKVIDNDYKY